MKIDTDLKITIVVLSLIIAACVYLIALVEKTRGECEAAGGVLVRAASGYVCVEAKKIK